MRVSILRKVSYTLCLFILVTACGSEVGSLRGDQNTNTVTIALIHNYHDPRSRALQRNVSEFNLTGSQYEIMVIDYFRLSGGNSTKEAVTLLNSDIARGSIPDVIMIDDSASEHYLSKGLLADLYPFIDADEQMSRELMLSNVLEASSRSDKLYQLIPSFYVISAAGKASNIIEGGGWTVRRIRSLINEHNSDTVFINGMGKSDYVVSSVLLASEPYFDIEAGICQFNSPVFVSLLELAKSMNEAEDLFKVYSDFYTYIAVVGQKMREDGILIDSTYIKTLRAARDMREVFDGEEVVFTSFPAPGNCDFFIAPAISLGISSKSEHKDACWQFLRSVLTDWRYCEEGIGLPLNAELMDKYAEFEMTPIKDRQYSSKNKVTLTQMFVGGMIRSEEVNSITSDSSHTSYADWHLTQAEVDQVMEVIASAHTLYIEDRNIAAIISEETEPFFAGHKTAEQTAEIIQERMSIYLSE